MSNKETLSDSQYQSLFFKALLLIGCYRVVHYLFNTEKKHKKTHLTFILTCTKTSNTSPTYKMAFKMKHVLYKIAL